MNQDNTDATFADLVKEDSTNHPQPTILERRLVELDRVVTSLAMIELQNLSLPHTFYQEVRAADAVIKNAIDILSELRLKAVVKMKSGGMSIEAIALMATMTPEDVKGLLIYHQNYVMPKGVSSEILSMEIKNTFLNARAKNCMTAANINTLGDLVARTEEEVLKSPNFGPKLLTDVKEMLASYGLALKNS